MTPHGFLLAIYGTVFAGVLLLLVSNIALILLLRYRYGALWRTLGSPWFSYMQTFTNPKSRQFLRYIRAGQFSELSDRTTHIVAAFVRFEFRFGPWWIFASLAMAALIMWRGGDAS
jgi:hypothetical protein